MKLISLHEEEHYIMASMTEAVVCKESEEAVNNVDIIDSIDDFSWNMLPVLDVSILKDGKSQENNVNLESIDVDNKLSMNVLSLGSGYKCNYCSYVAKYPSVLKRHLVTHSDQKPFVCNICSTAVKRKCTLQQHYMNVHGIFPEGTKRIECVECGFTSSSLQYLRRHMRTHSRDYGFECIICSKAFKFKGSLKKHMRVHFEERGFNCRMCSKTFKSKTHLKRHMRAHSEERPFNCRICSKRFKRKGDLKQHMLSHSEDRPFECTTCFQAFKRKDYLKKHVRICVKKFEKECADLCETI